MAQWGMVPHGGRRLMGGLQNVNSEPLVDVGGTLIAQPLTPEEKAAARRLVTRNAQTPEEAQEFLTMLDINN